MYAVLLTQDEEPEFRMDRERCLLPVFIDRDTPVVVRIESKGALGHGEYGVEYGGIVVLCSGKLMLETRFLCDPEGRPRSFPLQFGDEGLLYSTPLPALRARSADFGENNPPRWTVTTSKGSAFLTHRATPAMPSRPIGYVLEASHARQKIGRPVSENVRNGS